MALLPFDGSAPRLPKRAENAVSLTTKRNIADKPRNFGPSQSFGLKAPAAAPVTLLQSSSSLSQKPTASTQSTKSQARALTPTIDREPPRRARVPSAAPMMDFAFVRVYKVTGGLGVMALAFHPRQPWLFTAGADGAVRLFQDV